jgi:hypothetical protein
VVVGAAAASERHSVMRQQQLDYERQSPASTLGRLPRMAIVIGPMLLATFLPIWTVWYIGPWEATGERGTFWSALQMLPDNFRTAGFAYVATTCLGSNVATAGILLVLGFGVERFVFARGRRAAA